MNSRDIIRHPGPETEQRALSAAGHVQCQSVSLSQGQILMEAVARLMEDAGGDSAVIVLDGVDIGPFNYVMPSESSDGLHAAWYSATHSCAAAHMQHATAIVGRRDGAWWMHCHAVWQSEDSVGMGHLLPDDVTIAGDATVTVYRFDGGRFDVALDPETAFPIFHAQGGQPGGNALIAKINPHEDIHTAITDLITAAGFEQADIYGIGSLIGARFEAGNPMECPISEVLIGPEASWDGSLQLPMYCVDIENNQFEGTIVKDGAPVLVTFELMIVDTSASSD